jgi:hypothetical protein
VESLERLRESQSISARMIRILITIEETEDGKVKLLMNGQGSMTSEKELELKTRFVEMATGWAVKNNGKGTLTEWEPGSGPEPQSRLPGDFNNG